MAPVMRVLTLPKPRSAGGCDAGWPHHFEIWLWLQLAVWRGCWWLPAHTAQPVASPCFAAQRCANSSSHGPAGRSLVFIWSVSATRLPRPLATLGRATSSSVFKTSAAGSGNGSSSLRAPVIVRVVFASPTPVVPVLKTTLYVPGWSMTLPVAVSEGHAIRGYQSHLMRMEAHCITTRGD